MEEHGLHGPENYGLCFAIIQSVNDWGFVYELGGHSKSHFLLRKEMFSVQKLAGKHSRVIGTGSTSTSHPQLIFNFDQEDSKQQFKQPDRNDDAGHRVSIGKRIRGLDRYASWPCGQQASSWLAQRPGCSGRRRRPALRPGIFPPGLRFGWTPAGALSGQRSWSIAHSPAATA
jgi:hypothetical protein